MKEAVHTKTVEEFRFVSNKLNLDWDMEMQYNVHKEKTCVNLIAGYGSICFYYSQGYEVITFEEFKSRYKLKQGDTFEYNGFICEVKEPIKKWYYNTRTDKYVRTKHYGKHLTEITNQEFINQLEKHAK